MREHKFYFAQRRDKAAIAEMIDDPYVPFGERMGTCVFQRKTNDIEQNARKLYCAQLRRIIFKKLCGSDESASPILNGALVTSGLKRRMGL